MNTSDPFGDVSTENSFFNHLSVITASEKVSAPRKNDVTASGTPKNLHEAMRNPSMIQTGHGILITS